MMRQQNWIPLLLVVCILILGMVGDALGQPAEDLNDRALGFLVENAGSIQTSSREFKSKANPVMRGQAKRFPILHGIGAARLNMSADEVIKALGKPDREEESDSGWKWTYFRPGKKVLVLSFDLRRAVTQVFTNSKEFRVPEDLSIGFPLQDFERVYGSRRFRESTQISLDLRLLKYPFSNLAIVIDSDENIALSMMVFKDR